MAWMTRLLYPNLLSDYDNTIRWYIVHDSAHSVSSQCHTPHGRTVGIVALKKRTK